MRLSGGLDHLPGPLPGPHRDPREADLLGTGRPLAPLRHRAVLVTAHVAGPGAPPLLPPHLHHHQVVRAGHVGPAEALLHHLVGPGEDAGDVPGHEAGATGGPLQLTLGPGAQPPLVARRGGARFVLCEVLRTRSAGGRGRDEDVSPPGEVPPQALVPALALARVPVRPRGEEAVHRAVQSAGDSGVSGDWEVVTVVRRDWSAVTPHTPLASGLDPGPARGEAGGAAGGPVCEVPGVGPAGGVLHTAPALLQWRTDRAPPVRGSQHGAVSGLSGLPGALRGWIQLKLFNLEYNQSASQSQGGKKLYFSLQCFCVE